MDLIYATGNKEDIGIMKSYVFDLAFGYDENDFELKTSIDNHVCQNGYILYIEETEYGGIIDRIRVKTSTNELFYIGRTWHGILKSKIIEPDSGTDYLSCSGEANSVIGTLLARMGLTDLFNASTEDSELTIDNYRMDRYIDGYEGIKKMLASVAGKLKFNFQEGLVILSAEPWVDYSADDEFDSSQIDFDIEKNYNPVNHMICLGQGELQNRTVIDLYADANGIISGTQTQFGMLEVTSVYENVNVTSDEELRTGGTEALQAAWDTDSLQVNFDSTKNYDIGDIVGAREITTGIFMAKTIIKKIVTINGDIATITHKV